MVLAKDGFSSVDKSRGCQIENKHVEGKGKEFKIG